MRYTNYTNVMIICALVLKEFKVKTFIKKEAI